MSKAELKEGGEISEDSIRAQNQVALVAICEIQDYKGSIPPPPVIIATTHLKSSRSATGERYRVREVLQALSVIDNIQRHLGAMNRSAAVIFAGDFNAVPTKEYAEPLTYRAIKNHQNLSLRSVYTEDFPDHFPIPSRYLGKVFTPPTYLSIIKKGANEEELKRCIGDGYRIENECIISV